MNSIFEKKCTTEYFDITHGDSCVKLGESILKYINTSMQTDCTPVILCIGTDRATGDCLGPLVGDRLMHYNHNFRVLGCLSEPVHALNLRQIIREIYEKIENPFVIAIDASLGDHSMVGSVTVSNCPIFPGKGVNKKLPAIGDVSITGIVNVSGQNSYLLQSTRLHVVMQMADYIASALKYTIDYLEDF